MQKLLAKAIALMAIGFVNVFDKAGEPYILHCLRVMNNPRLNTLAKKIVGVLHDGIEDEIVTAGQLRQEGFSEEIIQALILLDYKHTTLSYEENTKALSFNELARDVKLADLEDNSQIIRLKGLTKADFDRMEKYHKAYTYLSKI